MVASCLPREYTPSCPVPSATHYSGRTLLSLPRSRAERKGTKTKNRREKSPLKYHTVPGCLSGLIPRPYGNRHELKEKREEHCFSLYHEQITRKERDQK